MKVSEQEFNDWLDVNSENTTSKIVPTPAAEVTTYHNSEGELVATIVRPASGGEVIYGVSQWQPA